MALDLSRYAPRFSVKIGGDEYNNLNESNIDLNKSILNLRIEQHLEGPSTFSFSLNEGTKPFRWLENNFLKPRADVDIEIGYSNIMKHTISGMINSLEPSFPTSGTPTLIVQGYDYYHLLRHPPKKEMMTFKKGMSYKDIVGRIAATSGRLSLDKDEEAPETKLCRDLVKPSEQTGAEFLEELAERLGCEVFARGKKLYFRAPQYSSDKVATLEWGKSLISFNPRLSTAKVVTEVTVRGQIEGKEVQAVATLKDLSYREPNSESGIELLRSYRADIFTDTINMTNIPIGCEEEAKILAKSILDKKNNELVSGSCECIGNPEIAPGTNVEIKGVGKRFSGKYYVTSAIHDIGTGGYTTSLSLRRGFVGKV